MTKKKNDIVDPVQVTGSPNEWPETQQPEDGWAQAVAEGEPETEQSALPSQPYAEDWESVQPPQGFSELFIETHAGEFDESVAKYLFYGESGSGKTRLASTFPAPIFADIDMGMSSVDLRVARTPITKLRQMEQLHNLLASGNHDYETVIIDTLNELQRIAMGATVEEFANIRRAYNDLPSQSDYGKMLHDMMEITRAFIQLPMRVVLLAQINTRQFEEDRLMPQLIGKATAREITRKMDIVGCIRTGSNQDDMGRNLPEVVFYDDLCVTKDRSYRLPAVMGEPSWAKINHCF